MRDDCGGDAGAVRPLSSATLDGMGVKFTWAASWSLNVLTGQRSTPHWTPVTDADDGVTVGASEAAGVRAGEAVGVLDGESLPHAEAARSSVAASQPTKIRTQFRRGRRQSGEGRAIVP